MDNGKDDRVLVINTRISVLTSYCFAGNSVQSYIGASHVRLRCTDFLVGRKLNTQIIIVY